MRHPGSPDILAPARLGSCPRLVGLGLLALASLLALTGLLLPTTAQAQPSYFPVELGLHMAYASDDGQATLTSDFTTDEELVNGVTASRLENVQVGREAQEYWNYWTQDGQRTWLHGFWRPVEEFGVVYDPPILWVDADIDVGSVWFTQTTSLDFQTGAPGGTGTTLFEVMSADVLDVPAGTFSTLRIHWGTPAPSKAPDGTDYDLLGKAVAPRKAQLDNALIDWRALGTGLVQDGRESDPEPEWFKLIAGPVGAELRSWGDLKAGYGY